MQAAALILLALPTSALRVGGGLPSLRTAGAPRLPSPPLLSSLPEPPSALAPGTPGRIAGRGQGRKGEGWGGERRGEEWRGGEDVSELSRAPTDGGGGTGGGGEGGGGLIVLGLCCAIAAVCSLDRVVISIAILPMAAELGFSDSTKGLIASAFSLGYGVGLLPAGLLSALTSPKTVLGVGLVIWSFAQAGAPLGLALTLALLPLTLLFPHFS